MRRKRNKKEETEEQILDRLDDIAYQLAISRHDFMKANRILVEKSKRNWARLLK